MFDKGPAELHSDLANSDQARFPTISRGVRAMTTWKTVLLEGRRKRLPAVVASRGRSRTSWIESDRLLESTPAAMRTIMDREEVFGERRRALEESFFAKRNAELLAQLRQKVSAESTKQELKTASGITDEAILDHLLAASISAETITALGIVPLLAVAWADGRLDEKEKKAVLEACEAEGIEMGTSAYGLLDSWLKEQPSPQLLSAWKDFIKAAKHKLSPEALTALREDVVHRAQKIARASGGLLGINTVSTTEQEMVLELQQAFED